MNTTRGEALQSPPLSFLYTYYTNSAKGEIAQIDARSQCPRQEDVIPLPTYAESSASFRPPFFTSRPSIRTTAVTYATIARLPIPFGHDGRLNMGKFFRGIHIDEASTFRNRFSYLGRHKRPQVHQIEKVLCTNATAAERFMRCLQAGIRTIHRMKWLISKFIAWNHGIYAFGMRHGRLGNRQLRRSEHHIACNDGNKRMGRRSKRRGQPLKRPALLERIGNELQRTRDVQIAQESKTRCLIRRNNQLVSRAGNPLNNAREKRLSQEGNRRLALSMRRDSPPA